MPSSRSRLRRIPVAIALLVAVGGCRSGVAIQDVTDLALRPPAGTRLEDVSEAIWRAGRRLGWQIDEHEPGNLEGTLRVRRHVARVSITHDLARVDIRFRGADNLDRVGHRIHPAYNAWVRELAAAIRAEPIRPGDPAR